MRGKLSGLDIFSGIGGITKGLSGYVEPIAYCEQDEYCQSVLMSRMHSGEIPIGPIWDDISTLRGKQLHADIQIIYGGFPCQDLSVAGNGKGLVGERSGLYWHIERLVKDINPAFVFLENVPAIRTRGLNEVVQSLTELGYDCRWTIVSAAEVGAPHIRKRWFLLAHAGGKRLSKPRKPKRIFKEKETRPSTIFERGSGSQVDNALCGRHGPQEKKIQPRRHGSQHSSWWQTEPNVGRVVNELSFRVDRIKALGNAVVPAQVSEAFERLMGITAEE